MYARQILYIQSLIEIVYTLSKRRKKNDFKWQVIWVFKIKKKRKWRHDIHVPHFFWNMFILRKLSILTGTL